MNNKELFLKVNDILLNYDNPSENIKKLIDEGEFDKYPFNKIRDLKNIQQNLEHHPEGNVLNHTLLVIDKASKYKEKSKDKKVFMWSALLHDIGKLTTTKYRKGRITSYSHDLEGEILTKKFLSELSDDEKFIEEVSTLVKYHMQPLFYDKKLPFFEEEKIVKESDYNEIYLLSMSDRLGRLNLDKEKIKKEKKRVDNFKNFFEDKYK